MANQQPIEPGGGKVLPEFRLARTEIHRW
jgi:hypothetical protein